MNDVLPVELWTEHIIPIIYKLRERGVYPWKQMKGCGNLVLSKRWRDKKAGFKNESFILVALKRTCRAFAKEVNKGRSVWTFSNKKYFESKQKTN